nr:Uncharacterised protein [Klebsiella pneumoniae]
MPLGLLEHYCPSVALYYQCLGECQLAKITASDFERIFFHSSPGYMQELTTILAYMGIFALDAHYERGSQTSFQTIKSMLSRYLYRGEIDGVSMRACRHLLLNEPISRAAMCTGAGRAARGDISR